MSGSRRQRQERDVARCHSNRPGSGGASDKRVAGLLGIDNLAGAKVTPWGFLRLHKASPRLPSFRSPVALVSLDVDATTFHLHHLPWTSCLFGEDDDDHHDRDISCDFFGVSPGHGGREAPSTPSNPAPQHPSTPAPSSPLCVSDDTPCAWPHSLGTYCAYLLYLYGTDLQHTSTFKPVNARDRPSVADTLRMPVSHEATRPNTAMIVLGTVPAAKMQDASSSYHLRSARFGSTV